MLKPRKIIRDYTPDYKALDTLDKQTKTIQDLYDQVNEFYRFLSEPAFRAEIKGEQGPQGEQGERGHDGAKGDKGATGDPGPQGFPGPRGATGAQGLPGPTGPQGPEGAPGPEGIRGPRGYTGLQGPQGLDGAPGEKGDMGEPWGLWGVFNTFDELQAEAVRHDARFYLVASMNDENGDLYVYREKYNDFIFLNNVIYDLAFQIVQGPPGRNYLTLTKGEHCDEYGTIAIDKEESVDSKGYLHTNFILDYLKGNGIKSTQWDEDLADSHTSTLVITFDNGTTATITVKNGKGIAGIEKTATNVLVDTYTITFSEGNPFTYDVTNGKGIVKIEKTSTDVLTDTYTITWNDNTTTTYNVVNGKGINRIEKTNVNVLTDTYTIYWNDNTTTTYTVTNGRGVTKIEKTSTNVLVDTYTITYNDNTTSTFTVTNGKGISSIALLSTNVLTDTYRITLNDGTHQDYNVTNGRSVVSIVKTGVSGLVDTYTITYNDETSSTYEVTNGNGIKTIIKVGTQGLIDTYEITFDNGSKTTYTVTNGEKGDTGDAFQIYKEYASVALMNADKNNVPVGKFVLINSNVEDEDNSKLFVRTDNLVDYPTGFKFLTDLSGAQGVKGVGIKSIVKTSSIGLVDIYTITYTDDTTQEYTVTNAKSITAVDLLNSVGLIDTYRISFNAGNPFDFNIKNGKGIVSIVNTSRTGLIDTYTITYNDNTTSTFGVKSCTPYEEAVVAGYDKSIETFYGIIEGDIWIGPGQNYSDVYDNDDYKYENINVNNPLNIECIQDYIYVIYPADSEFMFNLTMSGFPVPMEPVDTTTIQDYYILKSVNQYDGNFNITI